MPEATLLALTSAVVLVAAALLIVEVRTRWGRCCAHRHWAWRYQAPSGPGPRAYTGGGRRPARRPRVTEGE